MDRSASRMRTGGLHFSGNAVFQPLSENARHPCCFRFVRQPSEVSRPHSQAGAMACDGDISTTWICRIESHCRNDEVSG